MSSLVTKNMCVYVCVLACACTFVCSLSPVSPSFLHTCRNDSHVKDVAEWAQLSPPFGLSGSLSITDSLSLAGSHVSTDHCSAHPSPLCCPAKRERERERERTRESERERERFSCHGRFQRDGPRTQIGRDTPREDGGGGERRERNALAPIFPPHCLASLCVFSSSRKPTAAGRWGRDAH